MILTYVSALILACRNRTNNGVTSDGGVFLRTCGVPQCRDQFFLPVGTHGLLRHHVEVSVLQLNDCSVADGLSILEPLIVQRLAFSTTEPQSHNSLPLSIAVKADSALFDVEVVISFSLKFTCIRKEAAQSLSHLCKQRDVIPGYYSTFSRFVIRILSFFREAEIVPGVFGYNSSIHECLPVPVQFEQLLKEVLAVGVGCFQEAVGALLDDEYGGG